MKPFCCLLLITLLNCSHENINEKLYTVIKSGDTGLVETLLENGADPNYELNNSTPVHTAIKHKQYKTLDLLLSKSANVNKPETLLQSTPIVSAVLSKDIEAVKILLKYNPDLLIGPNNLPLPFYAAEAGNVEIFELLYKKGMPINILIDGYQSANKVNVLMAAAKCGHSDLVKFLLETDIDPNQKDSLGDPSIGWALFFDQPKTAEVFLNSSKKIELNFKGYQGSALDLDEQKNYKEIIPLIKSKGGRNSKR